MATKSKINYCQLFRDASSVKDEDLPYYAFRSLLIIFLLVCCLLVWMLNTEMDAGVKVAGRIVLDQPLSNVQSIVDGVITDIKVKHGDKVSKDQVLGTLDPRKFESKLKEKRYRYYELMVENYQLNQQIFIEPSVKLPTTAETDYPDLVVANRLRSHVEENQVRDRLKTLNSQLNSKKQELSSKRGLMSQGIISEQEFRNLEQEVVGMEGTVRDERNLYLADLHSRLAANKTKLSSAKSDYDMAKEKFVATEIKSPINGTVNSIFYEDTGAVVRPGQDLFALLPSADGVHIRLQIAPEKISFIKEGTDVMINVNAYDHSVYGRLSGKVSLVSPHTVREGIIGNESRKAMVYLVFIKLDKQTLTWHGQELPLIPGMTVIAAVNTQRLTLFKYIMKPLVKTLVNGLGRR